MDEEGKEWRRPGEAPSPDKKKKSHVKAKEADGGESTPKGGGKPKSKSLHAEVPAEEEEGGPVFDIRTRKRPVPCTSQI